ncbi:MAG: hypothetical protein PVS3B1_34890 [Ktedonobacteraceae bacterium]
MSKKSKRMKQPQKRPVQPQVQVFQRLVDHAQRQMFNGNFTGAITTCENLRRVLPKQSSIYVEALALLGLAHAALQHYQESYDLFTEALTIDPTNAELWYNRGLASQCVTRVGQSIRDFEQAIKVSKNDKGDIDEITRLCVEAMAKSRQEVADDMKAMGEQISLDAYIERESLFKNAMQLIKQSQWNEAEQILRQLTEMGGRLYQYWGNLGVCLVMQERYDDAEAALKRSLVIDPTYPVARDNLMHLPEVRRQGHTQVDIVDLAPASNVEQTITFFERDGDSLSPTVHTTIEKDGKVVKETSIQLGLQPPRYNFLLNPYKDTRFTICPHCGNKTRTRKFSLVIHVEPTETLLWDKICRYCYYCDLLIMHQDKLEELLFEYLIVKNPRIIGNDYIVLGTVERSDSKRAWSGTLSVQEMLEHLHDFKRTILFRPAPA